MILWVIFVIECIIIYFLYKYSNNIYNGIVGWFGELWCKQELNQLPKDKYKILNNIYIMNNNYKCQIDHIVVSKHGIFCIETKQYNGYIIGSKYDKKWVRKTKNAVYYYTNPIRQNYGHIKTLSDVLNVDINKIYNIVCITSRAKINIQDDGETTRNYTILKKILSYNDEVIYNVDEIVERIKKINIKSSYLRNHYKRDLKKKYGTVDMNKCPKCGGNLVDRIGKYGNFKGCSNYPNCDYTQKIYNKKY